MPLKINKDTKVIYTAKDILEAEYPEMWQKATEAVDKLIALQKDLVTIIPKSKENIPTGFGQLQNREARTCFIKYIYLLSLYAFANKVAQMLEVQCRDLAEKENGKFRDETEDAMWALEKTLDSFETMPWDEPLQDNEDGLLRLNELKEQFKQNMDWKVLPSWSFTDIVGTIKTSGIQNESLWNNVNECPVPCESNIDGLLVDDNEMIRIY